MYWSNLRINISRLPEWVIFLYTCSNIVSHDYRMITTWPTNLREVPLLSFNVVLVHLLHPVFPFQELVPAPHPWVAVIQIPHLYFDLCPPVLESPSLRWKQYNLKCHLYAVKEENLLKSFMSCLRYVTFMYRNYILMQKINAHYHQEPSNQHSHQEISWCR